MKDECFYVTNFKDTIPIFMAEFGDFSKWPRDGYNEVNVILAYGV